MSGRLAFGRRRRRWPRGCLGMECPYNAQSRAGRVGDSTVSASGFLLNRTVSKYFVMSDIRDGFRGS